MDNITISWNDRSSIINHPRTSSKSNTAISPDSIHKSTAKFFL